jgi:RNA-directed DNA polymerase
MDEHTGRVQDRETASRGLHGVREAAQRDKALRFTTLLHHVNERLLLDRFYLLKRQAAPGVDRVTWGEYEQGVEARITDLHDRVHRGAYRAQPSRRVTSRNRTAGNDRWESRRWKIKSCNKLW